MRNTLLLIVLSAGCKPSEKDGDLDDTGTPRTPLTNPGDDSGSGTGGTDDTGSGSGGVQVGTPPEGWGPKPWVPHPDTAVEPPPPVFDCAKIPAEPTEINEMDKPKGYHDVIFDTEGYLLGSDGHNLTRSPDNDSNAIWIPNTGTIQGMDWLADGDIVAASTNAIIRINDKGKTILAPNMYAYGVTVGPDNMVYVAESNKIWKIDPDTGDKSELFTLPGGATAKVIQYSPDLTRMYVGTISGSAVIFMADLDDKYQPTSDLTPFVTGVGGGYHDGLGVDVCGNLYVNDYNTLSLYRVTPSGVVTLLKGWSGVSGGYGHGQEWGSGLSIWRTDAIYLPQPYDHYSVVEVVIGIPSRKFNGGVYEVLNAEK